MTVTAATTGVPGLPARVPGTRRRPPAAGKRWLAAVFLLPALVLLGALVVYPTVATVLRSFYSDSTSQFVGLANYQAVAHTSRILTALKNTAIWVAVAPAVITGLGLVFALLTERVRYGTAVKLVLFMPMAVSFVATGVIWRGVYDPSPARGLLNATVGAVYDAVVPPGPYPQARPAPAGALTVHADGSVYGPATFRTGQTARLGLVALPPSAVPATATQAAVPTAPPGGLAAVVWRDFKPGGGKPGVVESGELGLPGATVEVVDRGGAGHVVATGRTGPNGDVVFSTLGGTGPYQVRLAAATFATGFRGIDWLGPTLVTYAIIAAFCWMWAGFAVVVVAAGLSALPRDVLEAARTDGGTEWQVFHKVTLPLLAPVLGVVFVTMVINVLKIFDIVLVTAPGSSQAAANVLALEMYNSSFTAQRYGLGSAVAVLLFLLVVPFMILNLRRFRREQ